MTDSHRGKSKSAVQSAQDDFDGIPDLLAAQAERDRLREALSNVRSELSNGPTANWEFIEQQWEVLDA